MGTLRISLESHAPESLRQHVRDHLDTFNVAVTGLAEYHTVSVFLRDEHDEVLGGLLGNVWGGWLHVAILWVAEGLRGRGYGRQLLEAAERYAVQHGCTRAWLTTFSFQAPAFYPKLGYETFAVLEDYPTGHRHHFLQKRLAATP
ncbi:MAG: GNAT family N-acetyltransferase [Candidatus Rokuibacteriota bacterium]